MLTRERYGEYLIVMERVKGDDTWLYSTEVVCPDGTVHVISTESPSRFYDKEARAWVNQHKEQQHGKSHS